MEIDSGFRLCSFTRAGRIAVSVDIAGWLVKYNPNRNFHFYHVGWKTLRGCYGDHPYPIFWITLDQPRRRAPWDGHDCDLTQALLSSAECSVSSVKTLIKEYREMMEGFIIVPYIDPEKDVIDKEHDGIWKGAQF